MGILEGKKALIIGASGGIGLACAEKFIEEGAEVLGSYRNTDINIEERYRDSFSAFRLDLSDRESISSVIKSEVKKFGGVDILVNAAGITCPEPLFSSKSESWENVISCNLLGTYSVMQSVMMPMLSRGKGAIINISSVFGIRGGKGQSSYCASKAGIIGLTKSAALEMAVKKIRVNAVAPGYIETAMTDGFDERFRKKCIEDIPMKRFGKAEEVADICAFLASDKAEYITGQTFVIDGGLSI